MVLCHGRRQRLCCMWVFESSLFRHGKWTTVYERRDQNSSPRDMVKSSGPRDRVPKQPSTRQDSRTADHETRYIKKAVHVIGSQNRGILQQKNWGSNQRNLRSYHFNHWVRKAWWPTCDTMSSLYPAFLNISVTTTPGLQKINSHCQQERDVTTSKLKNDEYQWQAHSL